MREREKGRENENHDENGREQERMRYNEKGGEEN
jgi:hypothetical protein